MRKNGIVIIVFILLVVFATFPLVVYFNKGIPGFFSTDESFGALWDSWRIKFSFTHKLPFGHASVIAYPSGINLYDSGFVSYIWMGMHYALSILTNPILTFNIQVFVNFLLNGFFTYLLVYYLTKERMIGIFSGIIFAFCPYQFVRVWQHLGLSYNGFVVFCLYALILLRQDSKRIHSVLFFLSLILLLSFDFSNMFLGFITLCAFVIYVVVHFLMNKKLYPKHLNLGYLKKAAVIATLAIFMLFFQFFPLVRNLYRFSSFRAASAHNLFHRSFDDLFQQSARPLSYFLPASFHPIFGKFTEQLVGSDLYGVSFTEHTLYLGWIPLALAFLAFRRWRNNRKSSAQDFKDSELYDNFYVGFFIFLTVVAWLFSQPPWWKIGPLKIYMPSFFMYKILPMYRAYCRFGIVIMLAIAVLAGYGLKFTLARYKARNAKFIIFALFCGLVFFEFLNWPPYKLIDVSKVPGVYYWLKEQPKGIVIAEYPLDADSPNELYKFFQTVHEKRIVNGTMPGTPANKVIQTIRRLSMPKAVSVLKSIGVRYVIVHKEEYLKTGLVEDREDLEKIPYTYGLKLVKNFSSQECFQEDIMCVYNTGPIDVYEVSVN